MSTDPILNRIFMITERMVIFDGVDDVLEHIVKTAVTVTHADAATIRAFDVRSGVLHTIRGFGAQEGKLSQPPVRLGKGVAGRVAKSGETVVVKDVAEYDCAPEELEGIAEVQSILCVPMQSKDSTIGCISVFRKSKQPYTEHDDLLLRIFSSEAVEAVEKARLIEELKRQATVDSLTNLLNKTSTLNRLMTEVERGMRYGHPLALFFIDLDGFKRFNDAHGHLLGDKLLFDFAAILKKECRLSDVIGRFGGDEFVVIAPQTNAKGASILAERLVRAVADYDFRDEALDIEEPCPVTCSIGLALLPDHAQTADELLARADKALYASKHEGKNQVVIWTPQLR